MSRALRVCSLLLVLTNLAFVELTEAASWSWLGPLALLTVLAPQLQRLTVSRLYRFTWNAAVIGVFLVLVRHTTTSGARLLLEDGLLLAALCQVHLLCNLGRLQKPDLLFFNSFLIAVVTSFLSIDVAYFFVFVLYALVFSTGVSLLMVSHARLDEDTLLIARTIRRGLVRGAGILVLTAAAFVVLPRDFHRTGFMAATLHLRPGGLRHVDFSDRVDLSQRGAAEESDRVVARVRLLFGRAGGVPEHWRGATLDSFDGERWTPAAARYFPSDRPWHRARTGRTWLREGGGPGSAGVQVTLVDASAGRLFLPLSAERLEVAEPAGPGEVQPAPDLTFRIARPRTTEARYVVETRESAGGSGRKPWPGERASHLQLPSAGVSPFVRGLARKLRATVAADAPQDVVVDKLRRDLMARYRYLPPGAEGEAVSLDAFLAGRGGGHCEFFATALAVLLRCNGIACRLVTGYRASEWEEDGKTLLIRARDAHAWVEVLDPKVGWRTVDPTPAGSQLDAGAAGGLWGRLRAALETVWNGVASLDAASRRRALEWVAALPARAGRAASSHPWRSTLFGVLLVSVLFSLHRRKRRAKPASIRRFLRAAKKAGLRPRPSETPREFLQRARADLPPDRLPSLESAVTAHETARYAGIA